MLAVSTHKEGGGWADEEAGRPASLPASPSDKIEVAELAALRHENLTSLRAYYFVGAGALSSLLHNSNGAVRRACLGFTSRVRIAQADPNGVAFIHGDGVVLLKMLTGKLPANTVPGFDGVDLSQWISNTG
uniref:Uncharacterized protein n=1 Tax=Oryza barthii TaxID=65489 RepID=A0A0D3GPK9_9ORYZ